MVKGPQGRGPTTEGVAVAGWQTVLDTLVRERGPALVGYGFLLTGDLREAEDLLQDSLVKVFARGRPAREVVSAEAYVRRTMLTTHVDGFRRRKHWASIRHLVASESAHPGDTSGIYRAVAVRAVSFRPLGSCQPATRWLHPRDAARLLSTFLRTHEGFHERRTAGHSPDWLEGA